CSITRRQTRSTPFPYTTLFRSEEHHDEHEEKEHEATMDFLGQPKDWIDAFSRHFYPSSHSHLDKPGEAREILPWLRVSRASPGRSEEHTSELQSLTNLVCRLLL